MQGQTARFCHIPRMVEGPEGCRLFILASLDFVLTGFYNR